MQCVFEGEARKTEGGRLAVLVSVLAAFVRSSVWPPRLPKCVLAVMIYDRS